MASRRRRLQADIFGESAMNRAKAFLLWIVSAICVTLVLSLPAVSQQRMGIAAGVFELAANAVESIPTYCLDFTRDSPTSTTAYSHILTDPEDARVVGNGISMSLGDAMKSGRIEIKGQDISTHDFLLLMNDPVFQQRLQMPADLRTDMRKLLTAWNQATPSEKKDIEESIAPVVAQLGLGDHTHLRIVSHFPQPVRLEVSRSAVVSPTAESAADVDTEHLGVAHDAEDQRAMQSVTWQANTARQQAVLHYLGYYNGDVDGVPGRQTRAAVAKFQSENGRPATGVLDGPTNDILYSRFNDRRLMVVNGSSPDTMLVTVAFTPNLESGRYSVWLGPGALHYSTNDPGQLAQTINEHLSSPQVRSVYLDLQGFPEDRAAALTSTLKTKQAQIDGDISISGLPRVDGGVELQDLMFEKGVKLSTSELKTEEITSGEHQGWFRSVIDFTVRVGNFVKTVSLVIYTRSGELAQSFFVAVKSVLATQSVEDNLSLAQLLPRFEREWRSTHPEASEGNFRRELRAEVGAMEVVELPVSLLPVA
jgi:peptidoglycan hydrolase-like protein with peptidoglycan-binding domain